MAAKTTTSNLSFSKMQRQLTRIKTKARPKIPTNNMQMLKLFQSPDIINEHGYTLDASSSTKEYTFCIFASFAIINMVKHNINPQKRHYLIDGTFKTVPRTFYQLLIVSIEFKNDVSSIS